MDSTLIVRIVAGVLVVGCAGISAAFKKQRALGLLVRGSLDRGFCRWHLVPFVSRSQTESASRRL